MWQDFLSALVLTRDRRDLRCLSAVINCINLLQLGTVFDSMENPEDFGFLTKDAFPPMLDETLCKQKFATIRAVQKRSTYINDMTVKARQRIFNLAEMKVSSVFWIPGTDNKQAGKFTAEEVTLMCERVFLIKSLIA